MVYIALLTEVYCALRRSYSSSEFRFGSNSDPSAALSDSMLSRSVVIFTRCVRNSRMSSYTFGCFDRVGIRCSGNSGKVRF